MDNRWCDEAEAAKQADGDRQRANRRRGLVAPDAEHDYAEDDGEQERLRQEEVAHGPGDDGPRGGGDGEGGP